MPLSFTLERPKDRPLRQQKAASLLTPWPLLEIPKNKPLLKRGSSTIQEAYIYLLQKEASQPAATDTIFVTTADSMVSTQEV